MAGPKGYPRFYAVNDKPVKLVLLADGSGDAPVYDFTTDSFKSDVSYFSRISGAAMSINSRRRKRSTI